MKTVLYSPQTTMKQINPITMQDDQSETKEERENNYFPGCRKDANCDCNMCLDSISATLDLMPMSVQRSSLTKLSASKLIVEKTPVSIDPTLLSTPVSKSNSPRVSEVVSSLTALRSTAKTGFVKKDDVKKAMVGSVFGSKYCRWVLFLGLILGFEFGFSWGGFSVLQPSLSGEMLKDIVENSSTAENFSERLSIIQKDLNNSVNGKLSSCIVGDSTWKVNQDGLILISYCILYQSAVEEVIIWGWPLHTAGLFTAGFSPRLFNVLSGRVTEWPNGKMMYVVREKNATWSLRKWSASVVQFEPNTWIIEYKRSSLLENSSIVMLAVDFIKFRTLKLIQRMRKQFWILHECRYYNTVSKSEAAGFSVPT